MATDHQTTAEKGRRLAARELRDRGATVSELRQGNRVVLEARNPRNGEVFHLRVKTRTAGTWQGSTRDGDPDPAPREPAAFWIFVDLQDAEHPGFYVAPDDWTRRDIHRAHQQYLSRHGGERAIAKDSDHHAIEPRRVLQWRGRWDLLGL